MGSVGEKRARAAALDAASPRDRLVATTAELIRAQGYAATGLNEIAAVARAPKGSIYHYFPGGKEQLGAEAVRHYGETVLALIEHCLHGATLTRGIDRFITALGTQLEQAEFQVGCPVALTALESTSAQVALTRATSVVFDGWITVIDRHLRDAEIPHAKATATTVVAAIEGGIVLACAQQSLEPLHAVGQVIEVLLNAVDGDTGEPGVEFHHVPDRPAGDSP